MDAADEIDDLERIIAATGLRPPGGNFETIEQQRDALASFVATMPLGSPTQHLHRLTSGFGYRADPFTLENAFHNGVDLARKHGTPIVATAAGRVRSAELRGAYGLMITLEHGNEFYTVYAHLDTKLVQPRDIVERGQTIATMGSTGRSTGPHLHYEIWHGGFARDPLKFILGERRT